MKTIIVADTDLKVGYGRYKSPGSPDSERRMPACRVWPAPKTSPLFGQLTVLGYATG